MSSKNSDTSAQSTDRRHNFFIIDNEVLDMGLSTNALATYMVLARMANYDNKTWPAHATIGEKAGIKSRTTIVAAINELVDAKLVKVEHRTRRIGGKSSNLYVLLPVPKK